MSSGKDCGNHGKHRRKFLRKICAGIIIFNIILLFAILLIFLILRPRKPRLILQDVTVFQFNVTSPSLLSSYLQVTIASRNPNDKIGVYYDRLDVYASYRNQQITLPTGIPSTYQGHKGINVWSPFLLGASVPIAPYLGVQLTQDQSMGYVIVNIKMEGRVRWKVGTWTSGRYHFYVNCPAYLTFGNRFAGVAVGPAVKYQLDRRCSVDV